MKKEEKDTGFGILQCHFISVMYLICLHTPLA